MLQETRVLLAEDDPAVRTMVARVLERRGCKVVAAADGRSAVSLFRERMSEIDVVVLDVRMPELEGPEALTEMRALSPTIPAILMSGFAPPEDMLLVSLLRSGVKFVPKPVRASVLADLIFDLTVSSRGAPPR